MDQLQFEWDEFKARQNYAKHEVAFEEARTVFNDPFSLTVVDHEHSSSEDRWIDIGVSTRGRLLVVWYTEHGSSIRIIGCRKATGTERASYEHG